MVKPNENESNVCMYVYALHRKNVTKYSSIVSYVAVQRNEQNAR